MFEPDAFQTREVGPFPSRICNMALFKMASHAKYHTHSHETPSRPLPAMS